MANISQKYAQALYDVAKAQDLTDSVLDELTQVAESVKEQISDLKAIDNNPKLAKTTDNNLLTMYLKVLLNLC